MTMKQWLFDHVAPIVFLIVVAGLALLERVVYYDHR